MSHKRKHSTADRTTSPAVVVDELLPRKAFSVTGVPDYTDDEPQTAEEYLRRVKHEARNQPRVFTSAIDPRRFDHLQTRGYVRSIQPLPATSARVMPSAEWESAFAAQFADIRQSFAHYAQLHPPTEPQPRPPADKLSAADVADETISAPRNSEAWARYCLGLASPTVPPPAPSLPAIAAFDQLTTRGVLAHIVIHLQQAVARAQAQQQRNRATAATDRRLSKSGEAKDATAAEAGSSREESDEDEEDEGDEEAEEEEKGKNVPNLASTSQSLGSAVASLSSRPVVLSVLSASTARWLYCLLAHLQKPLPSEAEVQLRQLYRVCGNLRAEVGKLVDPSDFEQAAERKQSELEQLTNGAQAVTGAAEEVAMWCNMLLTVVDRIFGQRIPVQVTPVS